MVVKSTDKRKKYFVSKKWSERASRELKSKMVLKGFTNKSLSEKLKETGIEYSAGKLRNKIAAGNFTYSFFMQILAVMDGHEIVELNN